MRKRTRMMLLSILFAQITLFFYYSIFGQSNYRYVRNVQKETQQLSLDIVQLENELKDLNNKIKYCQTSLFHEQYARTHLHMAREDEDIYLT